MDHLVSTRLFPFGVFDFCDSVGLDTMLASIRNYTRDYPHKDYFTGLTEAMESLIAKGRLGVKTHAGFYDYPMEDPPQEEPENAAKIEEHLHQTWFSSCKRFAALAHLPMDDMNHAIREYFSIPTGPFG
jgi:3-hydroxyacyl-CoA dehydrogenase